MKRNMSSRDSIIRLIIAFIIAVLTFMGILKGTPAMVLGFVDLYILFTVFFSSCLIYSLFKLNTNKAEEGN